MHQVDLSELFTIDKQYALAEPLPSKDQVIEALAHQSSFGGGRITVRLQNNSDGLSVFDVEVFAVRISPFESTGIPELEVDGWLALPPYVKICSPWLRIQLMLDSSSGVNRESQAMFFHDRLTS